MQREVKKYLFDVLSCIEDIETFTKNTIYPQYLNDRLLQRAMERNFEIIGEAINIILKIDDEINITDARKIVDMRNKIIHSYDEINPSLIWNVIVNHLPLLKQEIQTLLED